MPRVSPRRAAQWPDHGAHIVVFENTNSIAVTLSTGVGNPRATTRDYALPAPRGFSDGYSGYAPRRCQAGPRSGY